MRKYYFRCRDAVFDISRTTIYLLTAVIRQFRHETFVSIVETASISRAVDDRIQLNHTTKKTFTSHERY